MDKAVKFICESRDGKDHGSLQPDERIFLASSCKSYVYRGTPDTHVEAQHAAD